MIGIGTSSKLSLSLLQLLLMLAVEGYCDRGLVKPCRALTSVVLTLMAYSFSV